MKMKFACVALVVFGSLWACALDRDAFTFTKYDLHIRIEPEQERLGVRGKIALRNDSAVPQGSLSLQISSSLNWISIQIQGKPVEFVSQTYTSDIDHTGALSEAVVVLPQAVAPRQNIELEIGYEGVIAQDATRLTRIGVNSDEAKHSDWDRIGQSFTAVRGIGHVAWYPIALEAVSLSDVNAVPEAVAKWKQREDQAEMKATLDYSQSSQQTFPELLCDGTQANKATDQGALQQLTVECSYVSLNRAVPSFVIAPYSDLGEKDVVIHHLPDHKAGADDYGSAVEEVSPLIAKWFGDHRLRADTKSEVADLPDPNDGSFESGDMLFMPLTGSDTKLLLSAAQQLTHIYFPSPRAWIHDGLTNYAQARLIEDKGGRKAAIDYLQARRTGLMELEKLSRENNKNKDDSLISSLDDFRIQTKSMYVWWILRDMVGENALYAALHNYKASDDTDPKYMQRLIEAQAHRDLQWFFDDWVYHDRGLPDFRVMSVYPSKLPSGGYLVTVQVENRGEAGAEISVTLHMQDSEASGKLVVAGRSKASIRIQCPSLPQDAMLNDGSVPESDISNDVYKIDAVNH
jgi:hypothetical protein